MKFSTGAKTIIHDGQTYDPWTTIELDEAQGKRMGLSPVASTMVVEDPVIDEEPGAEAPMVEDPIIDEEPVTDEEPGAEAPPKWFKKKKK